MKKVSLVLFGLILLVGCRKSDFPTPPQSISDDLDYLAVNYFMQTPDGDYQNECKLGFQISNADAIHILRTRINNVLGIKN
jgi:hypothetical protein